MQAMVMVCSIIIIVFGFCDLLFTNFNINENSYETEV